MSARFTTATCSGVARGVGPVVDALRTQRARVVELARRLGRDEWDAPSRCTEWTVHEVVRHLVDWLDETAGPSPPETCEELERTTAAQLRAIEDFDRSGANRCLPGPYGEIHWTMFVLHVFWDSWLHERDILAPLGRPHGSGADEDRWAATYGVSIAGIPALMLHPGCAKRSSSTARVAVCSTWKSRTRCGWGLTGSERPMKPSGRGPATTTRAGRGRAS